MQGRCCPRLVFGGLTFAGASGVNTGDCITGDPDCDGDASATSALLASQEGIDEPNLELGEYAVFGVSFSPNHAIVPLNKSQVVLIGKPSGDQLGQENVGTIRAARYGPSLPQLWHT